MSDPTEQWEMRLAALWASLPEQEPTRFRENVQKLVEE